MIHGRFGTIVQFGAYAVVFSNARGQTIIASFGAENGIHPALEAADNLTGRLNTALFKGHEKNCTCLTCNALRAEEMK